MHKFKTGDKVRINDNAPGARLWSGQWSPVDRESYPVGKEAVVGPDCEAYDRRGNVLFTYSDGGLGLLSPECLDLVTDNPMPERKFKVGDKVRINANDPGGHLTNGRWLKIERENYPVGEEAVVGNCGMAYDSLGNVWFTYPDGRLGTLAPECLDLVTDNPMPERKFKVGDKVRINDSDPWCCDSHGGRFYRDRRYFPAGVEATVGHCGEAYDDNGNVLFTYAMGGWDALSPCCLDLVTDSLVPEQNTDGEERVTSETGGVKGQKQAMYHLIPASALDQVAKHYGRVGSGKGHKWSHHFNGIVRNAWAFWRGENIDPETGSHRMAVVCWHALALLALADEDSQNDDRPNENTQ